MEVLPAIIEDSYVEVENKLNLVAPFVTWVQVDICDGVFVPRITWTRIEDLAAVPNNLSVDLHIMAADPSAFIARAREVASIRRITFHYEATRGHRKVIQAIRDTGRAVGVAINPDTEIAALAPLLTDVDVALVMGVNPGWGGQAFIPSTLAKVQSLKRFSLPVRVGVDGGVHVADGTAQACRDAGADFLVVGSDIFNAPNIGDMIQRLQQLQLKNSNVRS